MEILQQDLVDIIYNADKEKLEEKGLYVCPYSKLFKGLKIGNYGTCDLLDVRPDPTFKNPLLEITVYELKRKEVNIAAFLHAVKCVKGIKRYLELRQTTLNYTFNIVLIGSKINISDSFKYLADIIESDYEHGHINSVSFHTYEFDFDEIIFKNHSNYHIIDEGFVFPRRFKNRILYDGRL
jgi:hypothetical protein